MVTRCPRCQHRFPLDPGEELVQQQEQHSTQQDDPVCLIKATNQLAYTCWYYESLAWVKSAHLLANAEPGTFLLRDSADPRFLFSISVQTSKGPISVRIHYRDGYFRLDSEPGLSVPMFSSLVELVEYYWVGGTKSDFFREGKRVWIDRDGRPYDSVTLCRPLYCQTPSLKHLARLQLNKMPNIVHQNLPVSLKNYLNEYPYCV